MKKQKTKEQIKKEKRNSLFFCYLVFLTTFLTVIATGGFGIFFMLLLGKGSIFSSIFQSLLITTGWSYILFSLLSTWYEDQYAKIK